MPATEGALFYPRYAWFTLRERFTDLASTLGFMLLYPYFIWLLTQIWGRFNAYQGHYTRPEVSVYVAITELLFLTFLRSPFMQRSNADFSVALARPRSWLAMTFFGQFGTTLGGRVIYLLLALAVLAALGAPPALVFTAFGRLALLLPLLGVIEAVMATVLATAQLIWHETRYLVLPITKVFLALGGVFGPLADYGEPGRSAFLALPASDLFFQVGHFCVKGEFYRLSATAWLGRMAAWTLVFGLWSWAFYRHARSRHQSYGG